ncbi:MAG TPA: hypothetical protein VGK99_24615 [Acidobacteriota bacterium]
MNHQGTKPDFPSVRFSAVLLCGIYCASVGGLQSLRASAALINRPTETVIQGRDIGIPGKGEQGVSSVSFESRQGYRPLVAALHVHSRFSNGQYDVFELAAYAHQRNLDVLGLTDSFLTRIRYGLPPARKFLSLVISRDSISSHGIEKYFSDVRVAQQRFSGVVLLPGLEVAPYYYWRGSLTGGLRLFDFDRHLVLFGLHDPEVVRNLPVIENDTTGNISLDWERLAGPVLTALCGVLLLLARRERVVKLQFFTLRRRRRFPWTGVLCLAVAGVWAYREYPFGSVADPYSGRHQSVPYQRVIDYAARHRGIVFWSYPEARYSDVKMSGARMISDSHPEDLASTDGYRGFEGIYGDRISITQPGNVWDQLLMEFLRGERRSWPSVITGIDFHSFRGGGWYELDRGQTILWADEKTERAVLDALRAGRGYAAFQARPAGDLQLQTFTVSSGDRTALAGEVLEAGRDVTLTASIDWKTAANFDDGGSGRLLLIRDGKLIAEIGTSLPARLEKKETLAPGRHYYRLRFDYESYQILSNPIFVTVK